MTANKIHDVLRGRSRQKNFGDSSFLQPGDIRFGNNPADQHGHVIHVLGPQQLHQLRAERIVRAGKNREADDVDVFLFRRGGDHLRSLAKARVDHLHAGVTQRASDDLGAAIVAIEARFGDEHANLPFGHGSREYCKFSQGKKRLLGDGNFLVGSKDGAQGITDFAHSRIGFDRIIEMRHEVLRTFGGAHQTIEPPAHLFARTFGA